MPPPADPRAASRRCRWRWRIRSRLSSAVDVSQCRGAPRARRGEHADAGRRSRRSTREAPGAGSPTDIVGEAGSCWWPATAAGSRCAAPIGRSSARAPWSPATVRPARPQRSGTVDRQCRRPGDPGRRPERGPGRRAGCAWSRTCSLAPDALRQRAARPAQLRLAVPARGTAISRPVASARLSDIGSAMVALTERHAAPHPRRAGRQDHRRRRRAGRRPVDDQHRHRRRHRRPQRR